MREHLRLLVMTLVVSLIAVSAPGQAPSAGNAVHTPDYSKESFIIEKIRTVASFENDGTGSRAVTGQIRVQSEAGVQQWGVLRWGYSSFNEQVEIGYVRVRKPDGTVVETPAADVQDITSEMTRVAPMYSDYHEKARRSKRTRDRRRARIPGDHTSPHAAHPRPILVRLPLREVGYRTRRRG